MVASRSIPWAVDQPLDEPRFHLSAERRSWCEANGLQAVAPHLPGWIPQRLISLALFGERGALIVENTAAAIGPWLWAPELSNVHSTFSFDEPGFVLDGVFHAGPEHFFQRAKSAGTPDHEAASAALDADPSPIHAYAVGRAHALRPDWEQVKVDVMARAVEAKFTQNEALRALLVSTAGHPLVQLKTDDAFWGTGRDGRGQNQLGVLLMTLRTRLNDG